MMPLLVLATIPHIFTALIPVPSIEFICPKSLHGYVDLYSSSDSSGTNNVHADWLELEKVFELAEGGFIAFTVRLVRLRQDMKQDSPKDVTEEGISTLVRLEQLEKQAIPKEVTEEGISMLVRLLQ